MVRLEKPLNCCVAVMQIILEGNQDYIFFEEVTKATFLSGVLITHNYDQDQLSWFSELNLFTTCKVVYPAGIAI